MAKRKYNAYTIFSALAARNFLNWMPDKMFLKTQYRFALHKKLNLENPKTFNEKIQWLKINDRRPEYTDMVDKFSVKKYVSDILGEDYCFPVVGGPWNSFDEIDFDALPNQFVLKCNHDSGGLIICKDKSKLNIENARKKINKSMRRNFYWQTREWPYKDVKPCIFAEKYMVDESGYELKDYKFFCFNGEPQIMFIATDRNVHTKFDFFDMQFNHLPFTNGHPCAEREFEKPDCFEEMIELARKLSVGIPQVRIDFYQINGKVYFGEITFSHWSGMVGFKPEEWDRKLGDMIELGAD